MVTRPARVTSFTPGFTHHHTPFEARIHFAAAALYFHLEVPQVTVNTWHRHGIVYVCTLSPAQLGLVFDIQFLK